MVRSKLVKISQNGIRATASFASVREAARRAEGCVLGLPVGFRMPSVGGSTLIRRWVLLEFGRIYSNLVACGAGGWMRFHGDLGGCLISWRSY